MVKHIRHDETRSKTINEQPPLDDETPLTLLELLTDYTEAGENMYRQQIARLRKQDHSCNAAALRLEQARIKLEQALRKADADLERAEPMATEWSRLAKHYGRGPYGIAEELQERIAEQYAPTVAPGDLVTYTPPEQLQPGDLVAIIRQPKSKYEARVLGGEVTHVGADRLVNLHKTGAFRFEDGNWVLLQRHEPVPELPTENAARVFVTEFVVDAGRVELGEFGVAAYQHHGRWFRVDGEPWIPAPAGVVRWLSDAEITAWQPGDRA